MNHLNKLSSPLHRAFFLQCACLVALREDNKKPLPAEVKEIEGMLKPYLSCLDKDKYNLLKSFSREIDVWEKSKNDNSYNEYDRILEKLLTISGNVEADDDGDISIYESGESNLPSVDEFEEFQKELKNNEKLFDELAMLLDYLAHEDRNRRELNRKQKRLYQSLRNLATAADGEANFLAIYAAPLVENDMDTSMAIKFCLSLIALSIKCNISDGLNGGDVMENGEFPEIQDNIFPTLGGLLFFPHLYVLWVFYNKPEIRQEIMNNIILNGGSLSHLDKNSIIPLILGLPEPKKLLFNLIAQLLAFSAAAIPPLDMAEKRVIILGLLEVALADNKLGDDELELIKQIALSLECDWDTVDELRDVSLRRKRINREIEELINE